MVRFWDTSAIVPLVLEEPSSSACRRTFRVDPRVAVWYFTRVELSSAVRRRARAREITSAEESLALDRVERLSTRWTYVAEFGLVRDRAERLLGIHTLRTADALQLAAALVLVGDRPRHRQFVVNDGPLADAATAEGFDVIVPRR
jgi:predicted nucleic acid-binding protein